MKFRSGDYIYHNEYGVGKIEEGLEGTSTEVIVHFMDNQSMPMPTYLLERSVVKISPSGFRAFAYEELDEAKKLLEEDPVQAMCKVFEDFPGYRAKTEDIKAYLSPYLADWDAWWEQTQPKLKDSPQIDSTRSRLREYGIHYEHRSRAEEAYLGFQRIKAIQSEVIVYEQARRALNEHISGSELEKEKVDRLVKYIRNIISSTEVPINTRLDAVFRLEEWKLISASEISELLDGLLKHRFRLYHLDPYPLHRCIEFLKKTGRDPAKIDLLASGMCTDDKVITDLSSWVLRRSDPEIISQFLLTAMTENLPPELESSKFSSLNSRLNACKALIRGLSISHGSWQDIYNTFGQLVKAFGKVTESEKILFLLPELVNLAWNLHLKVEKSNTFGEFEVIDKLTDPGLRMNYILALLNSVKNAELPELFYNQIEDRLISTADKRGDDILTPLLSSRWSHEIDEAAALAGLVEKVSSGGLVERAGKRLCEIAGQANESDLINMIPYLDSFQRLPGTWSWSSTLEHVREKAFFELFSQPVEAVENQYQQYAPLMYAANKVAEIKKERVQEEVKAYQKQVLQLREKVDSLQNLLKEKESVMRELSSSRRGDTLKARFEERSKILKELVTSLAEFDRVTSTQDRRPREVEAMLRRFENMISAYKVFAAGEIGDQVPFNPQKHRLVEGSSLSPGEPVSIIEKGYLILDLSEKLRLLKPALVRAKN